jgi:GTP-binding protein
MCTNKQTQDDVYSGMIVGIHQRPGDLVVNVCKVKAVNNIRSATKSISEGIVPPIEIGLDQAVEYIQDDELVEVSAHNFKCSVCNGSSVRNVEMAPLC